MMLKLAVAAVCALSGRAAGALHDQIYTTLSLNGVSRLLDNTGQIGASTAADGSVGALYQIAADGDADSFVQNANGEAYVALITTDQLANNITVSKLLGQDKLKGLLAYEAAVRPADWSADSNPNGINPNGGGYGATGTTGMHWIDIGVPLFLLTPDDAVTVLARFDDSKTPDEPSRETLGVRLKFFQWAATDAATCLRRSHQGSKFCQPLGGYNVGASLAPIVDAKETIVVAAQMDGLALFHDHSWGGAASAASLAGMVALAGMVSKHDVKARETAGKNVVFLAFQGEQFNNIGSSAFMDSVGQGQFPGGTENPLAVGDIKHWLELSSMALIGDPGATTTYAHGATGSSLMTKLTANGIITANPSSELPPSSIKALRDWQPGWAAVDAVVVGDYAAEYSYNDANDTQTTGMNYRYTHNDNMRNLFGKVVNANSTDDLSGDMEHLCTSVCAMAQAVEELANGTASTDCTAGSTARVECQALTWQLLKAMLVDGSMRVNVTETVVVEGDLPPTPINRYTSVYYDQIKKDSIEAFMYWHMSAALSSDTNTSTDTDTDYSCEQTDPVARTWHLVQTSNPEGTANSCFNTTAFFMKAVSPGLNENLDGITNASYSTWVESTWNDGAVDLFLINDDSESNALLGVGLTYFVLVTAAVKYLSSAISQVAAASN